MRAFVTFDGGAERPVRYEDLHRRAARCATTEATPVGVATMLLTARETFALALYHYELFVVASAWSLLAVEAALRDKYSATDRTTLKRLIDRAHEEGLFDEAWVDRLQAGRQLRNDLMHQKASSAFSPAMAISIIEASHDAIGVLYSATSGAV